MSKKDQSPESNAEELQDATSTAEGQPEAETAGKSKNTTKKKSKKASKETVLKEEIAEKEEQIADLKDKYVRLLAEFDNFKKRSIKERVELRSTAAQDTLAALLPVLDDFDRAKKIADDENSEETFSEGLELLYQKIYNILNQRGLKPMDSNGLDFDSEQHEAITEIPAPSEEMKGKVFDTIEKGYFLNDKIIRYAKVVVGK